MENLLKDVSPTLKKLIIQNLQETESWDLSALTAHTSFPVGKTSNIDANSPVKEKTQSGLGIQQYLMSGVTLQIKYGDDNVKNFKLKRYEAEDFIQQIQSGEAFPCIRSEETSTYIPIKTVKEIRIEEENVTKDIKSKG
jgi:hypothetical protein